MKLTDTNLGGNVLYIIFLASVFTGNMPSIITDCLFPLLCHFLSCTSISGRQCAVHAGLKKIILEGRWKDRNILNWCHHWRQHAVELKPSFWRISWSADGVEIQRYATYFVFHSPRVWGLCSRSSLWIVESCLFMGFTCHSKPLSILYPSM